MKRFVDYGGEPYALSWILPGPEGIAVRCHCGSEGSIRCRDGELIFTCSQCMQKKIYEQEAVYRVSGRCNQCDLWFNEQLHDKRQYTHKIVNYACPHCGTMQAMPVKKRFDGVYYNLAIRDGREPYFGLELYFLSSYRGKPVWAINRAHLNYLLTYIAADQRQRPSYAYTRTASYRLPRYMKDAKNREGMIKLLTRMQNQT